MPVLRLFVIAESPLFRAGLRAVLGQMEDGDIVGESAHPDARDVADTEAYPDVIVVDPGADGSADDLQELASDAQAPGILVLGPVLDDDRLATLLARRAWGYVPRDADPDRLRWSVRAVANGLLALDPSLATGLFLAPSDVLQPEPPAGADGGLDELTAREREVLRLVALGLPNKSIARDLAISEHTVKFHVAAILAKLGAGSRTEAAHIGARRGLVTL